jgi:hypothetical protein
LVYSNYINKVSNTISVTDKKITITINNDIQELSNDFIEKKQTLL